MESGTTGSVALPLIDVSALRDPHADPAECKAVGHAIDAACRDTGFFLVTGHGIDTQLRDDLENLSREFFALDTASRRRVVTTSVSGSEGNRTRPPNSYQI